MIGIVSARLIMGVHDAATAMDGMAEGGTLMVINAERAAVPSIAGLGTRGLKEDHGLACRRAC